MKRLIILLTLLLIVGVAPLFAHSGGTDKYGGHNNRKTGGYHYHNAGSVHDANNPHQDHTTCGICSTSKKSSNSSSEVDLKSKDVILALQAGLKCMGYDIAEIDGIMGQETRDALSRYINDHH